MAETLEIDKKGPRRKQKAKGLPRFNRKYYSRTIVPQGSLKVKETAQVIWKGVFETYFKHYNEGRWAPCCKVFLKASQKSNFGHPKHSLIKLKTFIENNRLKTPKDLEDFINENCLCKDQEGFVYLPEVNMSHTPVELDLNINCILEELSDEAQDWKEFANITMDTQFDQVFLPKKDELKSDRELILEQELKQYQEKCLHLEDELASVK